MNQEKYLFRITQLLSRFREQVKLHTSNSEFNINIHAENILIEILNLLYDCDLENVNYVEGKTYPSIDLRDKNGKVAFQITSTANLDKVKNTIDKFIDYNIYKDFDKLYIFIITDKQKTYSQDKIDIATNGVFHFSSEQILDRSDLYLRLNKKNDLAIIKQVHNLLEQQFADEKVSGKWAKYCKGLEEYDNYLIKKFQYIDIKGFSPKINNQQVKISLDNIYVPLYLTTEDLFQTINDDGSHENRLKKETFTPENLIEEHNRIAILGDPGSGKSTLLKFLTYSISTHRKDNSTFSDLIPVYIRIADYSRFYITYQKPISEYIINHYEKKFEDVFIEGLENQNLILFFDGLDEINDVQLRHDIVTEVNNFIALYPLNKIIVSSRKVGYSETRLSSNFLHFEVEEFELPQIESFAKNWYLSIAENSDQDKDSANKKAQTLIKSISRNESVIRLARNPLLVTIIALIDYQGTSLPEKRAELYDIATSTFLENWVKQRRTARKITFDKSGLIEILAPIAFYMHENYSDGLIIEKKFKDLLSESYLEIYPFSSKREIQKDIKDIIDFIREDAGFIFEKGRNSNSAALFGFVHLTFQEYFTSIEFATRWKEGLLSDSLEKYVFNSNWHEVLLLASSQFRLSDHPRIGRNKATEFIESIINVKDEFPEMERPLLIVIRALKDEVEIQPALFEKLISKIFQEILSWPDENRNDYKSTNVRQFQYLISGLLKTRNYGRFLLNYIIEIIKKDKESTLTRNLIQSLMVSSEIMAVKDAIMLLLKLQNNSIDKYIFAYNTVWPVAEIVTTPMYKKAIIDYVNSDQFISSDKRLPPQFVNALIPDERFIMINHEKKDTGQRLKDVINAIQVIETKEIQQQFAVDALRSISWGEMGYVIEYRNMLEEKLPALNLLKIDEFIKKESKGEFDIHNENIIGTFNEVSVLIEESKNNLRFIAGDVETKTSFPISDKSNLKELLGESYNEIIDFLNFIQPIVVDKKKVLNFITIEDIDLYSKYIRYVYWRNKFPSCNEQILNLLLKQITNKEICENHSNRIISYSNKSHYDKIKINDEFKTEKYIDELKKSELPVHHKLLVLSILVDAEHCQEYIDPTIKMFRETDDEVLKNTIYNILNRILR